MSNEPTPEVTEVNTAAPVDQTDKPELRSVIKRFFKSRALRLIVLNGWLCYHLFAIIIAPASVAPSSRVEQRGWEYAAPYLQLMHLNHGFHFFSPEPAGSTLVAYVLEFDDGTVKNGRFPNKQIWPRLMYHRHFMLSEFLGGLPTERQKVLVRSYARNLLREHGATKVTLSRVTHYLASMERIKAGGTLEDPDSFEEEPLGTYTWEDL